MFETYQQQARTARDRKDKEDITALRNKVGWILFCLWLDCNSSKNSTPLIIWHRLPNDAKYNFRLSAKVVTRIIYHIYKCLWIGAAATINFSLAWVWLLQKIGMYFKWSWYDRKIISHTAIEPFKPRSCSAMFSLKRVIVHYLGSWPDPRNCVHTCVCLLFESSYYFFSRAPRAATIWGRLLFRVRLLFNCILVC